jgi:Family of unknown function (DUF5995)
VLAATIEELRSVALGSDDATGYFAALYARVTERVQIASGTGRFGDGQRMVTFARAFARRYLDTQSGARRRAGCWQACVDVADDPKLLIVQHLLLGINAHVNHDLPQVVVDLADAGDDLADLEPDFDAVNTILAETFPDVVRDIGRVAGWVQVAASAGGGRVFNFSLSTARAQAWRAAVRLHGLDAEQRAADVAELDRLVRVLAYLVTRPKPPLSWLVPLARRLEEDDPVAVTRSLLAHLA